MDSADLYQYSALPERHIRLLELAPGPDGKGYISIARIIIAHLDSLPEYHTLSYVWGDGEMPHRMVLGSGEILRMTTSLHEALPFVFTHCKVGYLWIDQICINQSDRSERGAQVALMSSIYSQATCVLIWLCAVFRYQGTLAWLIDKLGFTSQVSAFHEPGRARRHEFNEAHYVLELEYPELTQSMTDDSNMTDGRIRDILEELTHELLSLPWVRGPCISPSVTILIFSLGECGSSKKGSFRALRCSF